MFGGAIDGNADDDDERGAARRLAWCARLATHTRAPTLWLDAVALVAALLCATASGAPARTRLGATTLLRVVRPAALCALTTLFDQSTRAQMVALVAQWRVAAGLPRTDRSTLPPRLASVLRDVLATPAVVDAIADEELGEVRALL